MMGEKRRGVTLESVVLACVCTGYVTWVLSLPVFPTQDGPMHLYYAHVMLALFGHGPQVYGHFYRIKHLLPPYSAYYYLLIGLSRVVPLLLADKLVICGYLVSFVYGFRYLARAVGPAADQASLLATLLVLNWPLGMGFVNFCLGVSLALWTLGVWLRTVGQPGIAGKVLFVAMCVGLVLVHPVPLLAVLGYCTLDLIVCAFRQEGLPKSVRGRDVLTLGLGALTLGYLKLFTIAHATQQMIANTDSPQRRLVRDCLMYARGQRLSFFSEFFHHATATTRIYHLLLVAIVPLGLTLAFLRKPQTDQRRSLWFWLALGMIVTLPFVPHDLNASHYFADRLPILLWVAALLAMSTYQRFGPIGRGGVALAAVVGAGALLWSTDSVIRPAARMMARLESQPVEHVGLVGIAVGDWTTPPLVSTGLTFNPYLWAGVHYFRHNDAVLYNTPWLDLTVIPLGAREGLATGVFSANAIEDVPLMRSALGDLELRAKAMQQVRFAFVNHFDHPGVKIIDPLLDGWQCAGSQPWYAVCQPLGATR